MSSTDFKKLSKEMSGSGGLFGSLLLFVVIALVIAIFWASKTELDNVTRGQGKIMSSIENQMVQVSEERSLSQDGEVKRLTGLTFHN